jgi:hypothetical protein
MSYESSIQTLLENDPTIQGLVTSYVQSTTTKYMIWNYTQIPTKVSTDTDPNYEPTVQDKTINHYTSSSQSGGAPFVQTVQTVSCRAYYEDDSIAIRNAVHNVLNKVRSSDGCSLFYCVKQPVIPPSNSEDNYNAQVFVSVKTK